VVLGATWDLNSTEQSVDQLSAEGSIELGLDETKMLITTGGSVSGEISGAGNLKIVCCNVLTLTGTNTFTGTTTLSDGSVRFNSDRAFGAVPSSSTADKIVLQGGGSAFYAMSNLEWNANRGITNNMDNGATVTFGADGGVTWNIKNSLSAGTGAGSNQNLNIACYSGCSSSNRSTIVLEGSLNYSGSTTINNYSIYRLTGANQIPDASDLAFGYYSQLELAAANETVGSLSSGETSSTILLGSNTLTAGGNNATDRVFYGVISGTGGFTKSGSGSLRFINNHTYTGATLVSAGTLRVDANGSLGESDGTRSTTTVQAGATLDQPAKHRRKGTRGTNGASFAPGRWDLAGVPQAATRKR
jgi:autotransporter-associated beta strand protein